MKLIHAALLTSLCMAFATVAMAEESPKVVGQENGLTLFEDGYATMNGDEYDPRHPLAGKMLDYLESIGEIETIQPGLLHDASTCGTKIYARVDKSEQRMYVHFDCNPTPTYVWKTSTGLVGPTPEYDTYPSGRFGKQTHQSGKYKGGCNIGGVWYGNMSNAVYLAANGNYAIHGGCEEERLGEPRSHGCIRIARANAKLFRDMVAQVFGTYGQRAVRIQITK
jgi:hypothetical protein